MSEGTRSVFLLKGDRDVSRKAFPGYFIDKSGETRKDRRGQKDRRGTSASIDRDRRRMKRRQDDLDELNQKHEAEMRDVLDDFTA